MNNITSIEASVDLAADGKETNTAGLRLMEKKEKDKAAGVRQEEQSRKDGRTA